MLYQEKRSRYIQADITGDEAGKGNYYWKDTVLSSRKVEVINDLLFIEEDYKRIWKNAGKEK